MTFVSKILLALVLTAGFSLGVHADPIRIVSGTVTNSGINVQGENSTHISVTPDPCCIMTATDPRFTFAGGSSVTPIFDAFGNYSGSSGFTYRGAIQLNGILYQPAGINAGSSSFMTFTPTSPLHLPPTPGAGQIAAPFSLNFGFTMQGQLAATYYPNGFQNNPVLPIPLTALTGSGTGTFTFFYDQVKNAWGVRDYQYTFSTPDPTPEPATILLLGTGLAGILGYARRKRRLAE